MRTFIWKSIERINRDLHLPYEDWMQDWDIMLANPHRLEEFIQFYKTQQLDDDDKFALMSLIIASYEDALGVIDVASAEAELTSLISRDFSILKDRVGYWCCFGYDLEDAFKATAIMRAIWNNNSGGDDGVNANY